MGVYFVVVRAVIVSHKQLHTRIALYHQIRIRGQEAHVPGAHVYKEPIVFLA